MTEYCYYNLRYRPDMDQITVDIAASEMTNKGLVYLEWLESEEELEVWWNITLSAADKLILDAIVEANK